MNARALLMAFTVLVGMVSFGAGRAGAADPGDWEAGNWSGNLRPKSVGCSAMYFNPRDDYSFSLHLYPPGFRTFNITDSSLAYIYFTDDGDDIDEDKGFSGFLKENSSITFSVGKGFRTQAKVAQVLIASFEFGLPRTVIDAFVPGGDFTIQLPDGNHHYTIKLPPSQAAIARLKKCAGA